VAGSNLGAARIQFHQRRHPPQSPSDSGVDDFVAVFAPATGFETPIAIGFLKATGMVYFSNS
jgi:hypothetical protein